jgi:hypothetical protein
MLQTAFQEPNWKLTQCLLFIIMNSIWSFSHQTMKTLEILMLLEWWTFIWSLVPQPSSFLISAILITFLPQTEVHKVSYKQILCSILKVSYLRFSAAATDIRQFFSVKRFLITKHNHPVRIQWCVCWENHLSISKQLPWGIHISVLSLYQESAVYPNTVMLVLRVMR